MWQIWVEIVLWIHHNAIQAHFLKAQGQKEAGGLYSTIQKVISKVFFLRKDLYFYSKWQ